MCHDYQIPISFKLLRFIKVNDWQSILTTLCAEAFRSTILFLLDAVWDREWCSEIGATYTDSVNRRLLLQTQVDINVDLVFDINNKLFLDYFDEYNTTQFNNEFQRILNNLLQQEFVNVTNMEIEDLIVEDPIVVDTSSDTQSGDEDNWVLTFVIVISALGSLCICALCFPLTLYRQRSSYISPDANTTKSSTTSLQTEQQKEDTLGTNEKQRGGMEMVKSDHTSFEKHLITDVVARNIIMENTVSDMESDNDDSDEDDDMELDMTDYFQTQS